MFHMSRSITIALLTLAAAPSLVSAQSFRVVPPNNYAWAENIGFLNWADAGSPAGTRGAKFFTRPAGGFFRGFVWSENCGWINLGNGDGPYANTNNTNFGVNANGSGQLSGFAWGENIGWINFSGGALAVPAQPARIDFVSGRLRGYAWGENIGWINLDDAGVFVGLGAGCPCDLNNDSVVDDLDFQIFVVAYDTVVCDDPSMPSGCPADFNGDNAVDDLDFQIFVVAYDAVLCP
jgi:hypothetical protein